MPTRVFQSKMGKKAPWNRANRKSKSMPPLIHPTTKDLHDGAFYVHDTCLDGVVTNYQVPLVVIVLGMNFVQLGITY